MKSRNRDPEGYILFITEGSKKVFVYEFEGSFPELLLSIADLAKTHSKQRLVPIFTAIYFDLKYRNSLPVVLFEIEELIEKGITPPDSRLLGPLVRYVEEFIEFVGRRDNFENKTTIYFSVVFKAGVVISGFSTFKKKGIQIVFTEDNIQLYYCGNGEVVNIKMFSFEEFLEEFKEAETIEKFIEIAESFREKASIS